MLRLKNLVSVTIPSTVNVNQAYDNSKIVNDVMVEFSNCFGGCSVVDSVGAWNSDKLGLVLEPVKIVNSYAYSLKLSDIRLVFKTAKNIKKVMSQESVLLTINNNAFLV